MIAIPWKPSSLVVYPQAYGGPTVAHIVTPDFVKAPNSLFQNNGDVLCGAGGEPRQKSQVYVRQGGYIEPLYYDDLPADVKLCAQCLAHLRREYLPVVEENY